MSGFRGLSKRQLEVFEQIALGADGGHNPRTIEALLRRAMIEEREEQWGSGIPGVSMTVKRYEVPLVLHMEWCAWCLTLATHPESS